MARGGYGLLRLLPFLDPGALAAPPAPDRRLLRRDGAARGRGARRRGLDSRPGRHAARRTSTRRSARALRAAGDAGAGAAARRPRGARFPGRVAGRSSAATWRSSRAWSARRTCPTSTGAILFFEDLGERPYRIDRLITHLDLAGVFGAVAASSLGDFSGCREPEATRADSPTAEEVLVERLGRLPIPVALRRRLRPRDAQRRAPLRRARASSTPHAGTLTRARRRGQLTQLIMPPGGRGGIGIGSGSSILPKRSS